MSSSISFSARRAASGSKIAPDRGEAVFAVGDLLEGFFFHVFFRLIILSDGRSVGWERRIKTWRRELSLEGIALCARLDPSLPPSHRPSLRMTQMGCHTRAQHRAPFISFLETSPPP